METPKFLNATHPRVPEMRSPLMFDTWTEWEFMESRILGKLAAMEEASDRKPDEVSVLAGDLGGVAQVGKYLNRYGWKVFNEASDLVYASPFGTRYFVEYYFYTHPNYDFRIEVMVPGMGDDGEPGFSPLHRALLAYPQVPGSERRFPMPHFSYKVQQGDARTLQHAYSKDIQHLKDKGFIHAQTCQSTYGVFSYWLHPWDLFQTYLKPRINVRDDA